MNRSAILSLLAALGLLLVIVGASIWQTNSNAAALRFAEAARAQRIVLANIMLAIEDAETSQRGFLLTNDADYLQPLIGAEQTLPGSLLIIRAARPGDQRVVALQQALTDKMTELRKTLALAQSGNLDTAITIVRTNAGRVTMLTIRRIVEELEAKLDVVLSAQANTIARGGRLLVAIEIAGLVMVLALVGLIALGLRSYLQGLRAAEALTAHANETLALSNERLDETVRARTADLTAANEEIQRFAYIVSHDLRAPLVNIMGFTSELEQAAGTLARHVKAVAETPELREAVEEDIPEALRFIKSSTSKMDRLINAILKLSREGRRVLTPETLPMVTMLSTMTESIQHQATSKQAVIQIGQVPDLVGDRLAVEQIFTNVIDNALKYLSPGRPGVIRVEGRRDGDMGVYEVIDNGRGIAERDYERVFELFRRAGDQSTPGEGIGLAHVRALVRRLGGTIDCNSTLGAGTTFTIRLPATAEHNMEYAA